MPQTLWFPLQQVAAMLALPRGGREPEHHLVLSCEPDTVVLHDPDHHCEPRSGSWASCRHDVHPVGCGGPVDPDPYIAVVGRWALLPLDGEVAGGVAAGEAIRRGAAAGARWLGVSVAFEGLHPVVVARRHRIPPAPTRWTPALVHADGGRLGPYPALVADRYRHATSVVPAFAPETVEAIAAATGWRAGHDPTAPIVATDGRCASITHPVGGLTQSHVLQATAFGYLPLPGHWAWEITDPRTWPDPHRPWPCSCPTGCAHCAQPVGHVHDLHCPWGESGSGSFPRIGAGDQNVSEPHRHQPGCLHTHAPRWPLLTSVGPYDEQCLQCAGINTGTATRIPSYGGTTEYFHSCEHCSASRGHVDLSAVI